MLEGKKDGMVIWFVGAGFAGTALKCAGCAFALAAQP